MHKSTFNGEKKVYTHTHTHTHSHTQIYMHAHAITHTHTHADTRAHTHMWERGMFTHMQIWKDKFSVLSQKKVRMVSDGHHMAISSIVSGLWKKKLVLQKFLFLWEECGRFSCLRQSEIVWMDSKQSKVETDRLGKFQRKNCSSSHSLTVWQSVVFFPVFLEPICGKRPVNWWGPYHERWRRWKSLWSR